MGLMGLLKPYRGGLGDTKWMTKSTDHPKYPKRLRDPLNEEGSLSVATFPSEGMLEVYEILALLP